MLNHQNLKPYADLLMKNTQIRLFSSTNFEKGYWKRKGNQRDFLDKLASKLNITSPQDWGKITKSKFTEHGGNSLLKYYKSLKNALHSNYPEIEWKNEWFNTPNVEQGYWRKRENQRKFLDQLAVTLNITAHQDWGKVSLEKVSELGGSSLLRYHITLRNALMWNYPEIEWKKEWFVNSPSVKSGYWKKAENQREFFDKLAKKLNITSHQDWGKISNEQFLEYGGSSILKYVGSFRKALISSYPEIKWKNEWFIHSPNVEPGYWKKKENQRKFLDNLARTLNITTHQDWGKISTKEFVEYGGSTILKHQSTLKNALISNYPEVAWKDEWFLNNPNVQYRFWKKKENQRKFLDNLALKLNLFSHQDWGKVTKNKLIELGGSSLLKYHRTLRDALMVNYPEVTWKTEWFRLSKFPLNFWDSIENNRAFLDRIAIENHIKHFTDWQKISHSLIRSYGGNILLKRHGNSLLNVLKTVYPFESWNLLLDRSKDHTSESQYGLWSFIKKTFPNEEILMNFRHPKLLSDKSKIKIELDIWIPKFQLAFEYHGAHHFRDTFSKNTIDQKTRDELRRSECKKAGITLIEVPYWWDGDEKMLLGTLLKSRPDLKLEVDPIVADQETLEKLISDPKAAIPTSMKYKDSDFMMLSKIWNTKLDPTGWLMSEKYDGIRAYWDGSNFYNKKGDIIPSPPTFKSKMPTIPLDGELWVGRSSFHLSKTAVMSTDWSKVQFAVFDAPKHSGTFLERLDFLNTQISSNETLFIAPHTKVKSRDHLIKSMEDIMKLGGEGMIIREPHSLYTTGRSNFVLKVKPIYMEKVRVAKLDGIRQSSSGLNKFQSAVVENKCGRQFPLYHRVSQVKFPEIKVDSVLTIGFVGMHPTGVPRYPTIFAHHSQSEWKNIVSYFGDNGSPFRQEKCENCNTSLVYGTPQIHVKGVSWTGSMGTEPVYKLFSFCPDVECINSGIHKMKQNSTQFPEFHNEITNKLNLDFHLLESQGIKVSSSNGREILCEDFYTLESTSDLVASVI